ncbi:MAG: protein-L-isoaspartate O-methyltransferase, partial [Brevundimonas sp.]
MDFTAERKALVDSQVRVNDVTNHEIHMAMMEVPRERYCAPDRVFAAYSDASVEIAGDRKLMPARDVSKLL